MLINIAWVIQVSNFQILKVVEKDSVKESEKNEKKTYWCCSSRLTIKFFHIIVAKIITFFLQITYNQGAFIKSNFVHYTLWGEFAYQMQQHLDKHDEQAPVIIVL